MSNTNPSLSLKLYNADSIKHDKLINCVFGNIKQAPESVHVLVYGSERCGFCTQYEGYLRENSNHAVDESPCEKQNGSDNAPSSDVVVHFVKHEQIGFQNNEVLDKKHEASMVPAVYRVSADGEKLVTFRKIDADKRENIREIYSEGLKDLGKQRESAQQNADENTTKEDKVYNEAEQNGVGKRRRRRRKSGARSRRLRRKGGGGRATRAAGGLFRRRSSKKSRAATKRRRAKARPNRTRRFMRKLAQVFRM
jgi:hypothetical protein